jgi:hypothetical protein
VTTVIKEINVATISDLNRLMNVVRKPRGNQPSLSPEDINVLSAIVRAGPRFAALRPLQRLQWLLQFLELGSKNPENLNRKDVARWNGELYAFARAGGNQPQPTHRQSRNDPLGLSAAELVDLAREMKERVTKFIAGEMWYYPILPASLAALLTSPIHGPPVAAFGGDCRAVLMMAARDTLAVESRRIASCNGPDCERLFVRRKRGAYCSKRCSQRARTLRYLSSLSPEKKRQMRHDYYAAKVRQQKGAAIKVRQNQPIRPRPEERER